MRHILGIIEMRLIATCLLLATLCGCGGPPTVDATTDETAQASIERIGSTLDDAGKRRFMGAVMALSMGPALQRAASAARGESPAAPMSASETIKALHGLSADEIIAKAEALRGSPASP
jgi:hypothetical protein